MSTKSENINELLTALSKAQSQMEGAKKDSNNPFFKSKYADLAAVWGACREALSQNGLSIVQTIDKWEPEISMVSNKKTVDQYKKTEIFTTENYSINVCLVTILGHSSGQWMKSTMPIIYREFSPQGMGSAITYARRYALAAMVGVAQEDDDGNEASGKNVLEPKKEKPKPVMENKIDISYEPIEPIINQEMVITLENYLVGQEHRLSKFLKHFGIQMLSQLRLSDFENAKEILKKKNT